MTTPYPVIAPKKLIEVALPLDAINAACAREKSIRHGHPSTLHLWWARRPLAAARAVIFGQLVNDPSWKWELKHTDEVPPNHLKASWAKSRQRLFAIIEDLVKWENTTNEDVLEKARVEIRKSWRETCEVNKDHPQAAELFNPDRLPALHDPFAGGGSIPLEAQRLGLEAYATDLNPVAVVINKAMIDIPPRFAGRPPVGPPIDECKKGKKLALHTGWDRVAGLAEDVRRYGAWMREEALKRLGDLYPLVDVTAELAKGRPDLKPYVGKKLTVIAWIWARTVKSPNPAYQNLDVPLVSTFILARKPGKEVYVHPVVEGGGYRFTIKAGKPPTQAKDGTKAGGRGANFRCVISGVPLSGDYIKAEGQAGRMGAQLLATVAEGRGCRLYLPPTPEMEAAAQDAHPSWRPAGEVPPHLTGGTCVPYGLVQWADLFTQRQLVALTTLSDLVTEAREKVRQDAMAAGMADDGKTLDKGGTGATAYADGIAVYLACAVSRMVNYSATLCVWSSHPKDELAKQVFLRQALPMTWDFAETNPFSSAGGTLDVNIRYLTKAMEGLPSVGAGDSQQADAARLVIPHRIVSTDPPYFDNISYGNLSDFFYVWLRRSLRSVFPDVFATLAVPKAEELVATPYRHGGKKEAEAFFLDGMTEAMRRLAEQAHPVFPVTIYYAFKQSESDSEAGTTSSGWETFLDAVIRAGFAINGTWPMRTELIANLKKDVNALASSIILVCRSRPSDRPTISRRTFLRELNQVLPYALDEMTRGTDVGHSPVAPVDLSQAIIGPGMAVFSKYSAVLEADGKPMSVRTALQLINRFLVEDDFDADTQFCLHWFSQHGWKEGKFGDADTLARAKGTAVAGVKEAGVIEAGGGNVRLLKWADYPTDWNPETDNRLPVWEALHQLIRVLRTDGEGAAGKVLSAVTTKAEPARQLAYRLYTLCERAGWAEDARAYNELITSWGAIEAAAATKAITSRQTEMFTA